MKINQKSLLLGLLLVVVVLVGAFAYAQYSQKSTVITVDTTASTSPSQTASSTTPKAESAPPTKQKGPILSLAITPVVWEVGKSYTVNWQINNLDTPKEYSYLLELIDGPDNERAPHASGSFVNSNNSGSQVWAIPTDFQRGDYHVRLRVENNKTSVRTETESGIIKIIASASTPRVQLTSPVGGERWKLGSTHQVTWTSTNLPSTTAVLVCIQAPVPVITGDCIHSTNSGSYAFTVPDTFTPSTTYILGIQTGDPKSPFQSSSTYPKTIELYR